MRPHKPDWPRLRRRWTLVLVSARKTARRWALVSVRLADDSSGIVGFCALEYGVSRWSVPAAWVIGGVILMACSIWAARKGANDGRNL